MCARQALYLSSTSQPHFFLSFLATECWYVAQPGLQFLGSKDVSILRVARLKVSYHVPNFNSHTQFPILGTEPSSAIPLRYISHFLYFHLKTRSLRLPRLALNLQSSCFNLSSSWITDKCQCARLASNFLNWFTSPYH